MLPTSDSLNVGCGPHPAEGWWNIDAYPVPGADEVLDAFMLAIRYPGRPFRRAYVGHMLEHVPWDEAPGLLRCVANVVEPGGQIAVVGPDTLTTIALFADGKVSWETVRDVLEDDGSRQAHDAGEFARHRWNCTLERMATVAEQAGLTVLARVPFDTGRPEMALAGWPVVSFAPWQAAVLCEVPA